MFDIGDLEVVEVVGSDDEVQNSMLIDSFYLVGFDTHVLISSQILQPTTTDEFAP